MSTAADFAFAIQLAIAGALFDALPVGTHKISDADLHLDIVKNEDDPYEGVVPSSAVESVEIFLDAAGNRSARVHFVSYADEEPAALWTHGDDFTQPVHKVIDLFCSACFAAGIPTNALTRAAVIKQLSDQAL